MVCFGVVLACHSPPAKHNVASEIGLGALQPFVFAFIFLHNLHKQHIGLHQGLALLDPLLVFSGVGQADEVRQESF